MTGSDSQRTMSDDSPPVIVFSTALTRRLTTNDVRLPPTHVGVRRVRPSNRVVRDAFLNKAIARPSQTNVGADPTKGDTIFSFPPPMDVVYKVKNEDGTERRMTKKEKNELRWRLRAERTAEKKRLKLKQQQQHLSREETLRQTGTDDPLKVPLAKVSHVHVTDTSAASHSGNSRLEDMELDSAPLWHPRLLPCADRARGGEACGNDSANQKRRYHRLEVSSSALEEELAELRGERSGVPPVILSGPMARRAFGIGALAANREVAPGGCAPEKTFQNERGAVKVDDNIAKLWAESIKESMKTAENARSKEQMRPMAYQLMPEVWSRLRPATLVVTPADEDRAETSVDRNRDFSELYNPLFTTGDGLGSEPTEVISLNTQDVPDNVDTALGSNENEEKCCWSFTTIRRPLPPNDGDILAVYSQLHRQTTLHVSCGAKFGCDFLLYDGRREDRHAFAGLRVYCCGETKSDIGDDENALLSSLPLPSAYDLAGYVRGLNTAGKLALIATVVRTDQKNDAPLRVAYVDLALEKILSAPTHQKKNSWQNQTARREIGKNLSKKSGS